MRPTGVGWRLIAIAVVLLGAAYGLGHPALAVLGLGALLAVGAGAVTVAVSPPVAVSREVFPERVARSEVAVGLVVTTGGTGRAGVRMSAWERCALRDERWMLPVALPPRTAAGVSETDYQLPTDRRGVISLGPLRVEATDALGVVVRRSSAGAVRRLWVYPRTHPFDLRAASRPFDRDGGGAETAPADAVAFHALREYVPGDDRRRIHWRSSARTGTLMVRQNADVSRTHVTVVLDTDRAAHPDPALFEQAVEAAASVLAATAAAQVPARLVTTGGAEVSGRGSPADLRAYLDELAAADLTDGGRLAETADRLHRGGPAGLLVLACGAAGAGDMAAARRLAESYRPVVVARFARRTGRPPRDGGPPRPGDHPAAAGAASVPPDLPPDTDSGVGLWVVETDDAEDFCARWREWAG